MERTPTDVKLRLPARPESVSVIRHVLGAFAEALRLPDEHDRGSAPRGDRGLHERRAPRLLGGGGRPCRDLDAPHGGPLERDRVADHGRGIGTSSDTTGPGLGLTLIAAIADLSTSNPSRVAAAASP